MPMVLTPEAAFVRNIMCSVMALGMLIGITVFATYLIAPSLWELWVRLTTRPPRAEWQGNIEVLTVQTSEGERRWSGMCPHQGGPLGIGKRDGDFLTCPWHGCQFDLRTGACVDYGTCRNVSGMKLGSV